MNETIIIACNYAADILDHSIPIFFLRQCFQLILYFHKNEFFIDIIPQLTFSLDVSWTVNILQLCVQVDCHPHDSSLSSVTIWIYLWRQMTYNQGG